MCVFCRREREGVQRNLFPASLTPVRLDLSLVQMQIQGVFTHGSFGTFVSELCIFFLSLVLLGKYELGDHAWIRTKIIGPRSPVQFSQLKRNFGVVWLSDPMDKMSSGPVWLFDPMDKNSGVVWLYSPIAKMNSGVVWLSNPIDKTNSGAVWLSDPMVQQTKFHQNS